MLQSFSFIDTRSLRVQENKRKFKWACALRNKPNRNFARVKYFLVSGGNNSVWEWDHLYSTPRYMRGLLHLISLGVTRIRTFSDPSSFTFIALLIAYTVSTCFSTPNSRNDWLALILLPCYCLSHCTLLLSLNLDY